MRILSTISVKHIGSSFVFIATAKWIRIISYDMLILLYVCLYGWECKLVCVCLRLYVCFLYIYVVFYNKRAIESVKEQFKLEWEWMMERESEGKWEREREGELNEFYLLSYLWFNPHSYEKERTNEWMNKRKKVNERKRGRQFGNECSYWMAGMLKFWSIS